MLSMGHVVTTSVGMCDIDIRPVRGIQLHESTSLLPDLKLKVYNSCILSIFLSAWQLPRHMRAGLMLLMTSVCKTVRNQMVSPCVE